MWDISRCSAQYQWYDLTIQIWRVWLDHASRDSPWSRRVASTVCQRWLSVWETLWEEKKASQGADNKMVKYAKVFARAGMYEYSRARTFIQTRKVQCSNHFMSWLISFSVSCCRDRCYNYYLLLYISNVSPLNMFISEFPCSEQHCTRSELTIPILLATISCRLTLVFLLEPLVPLPFVLISHCTLMKSCSYQLSPKFCHRSIVSFVEAFVATHSKLLPCPLSEPVAFHTPCHGKVFARSQLASWKFEKDGDNTCN